MLQVPIRELWRVPKLSLDNLEFKKETALVNSFLVKPKATEEGKEKHGVKGAKKGSARGSKGKGKGKTPKNPRQEPRKSLSLPPTRRKMTQLSTRPRPMSNISSLN